MSSSFSNSSKSALIKERGSLLESLLEDSNRLAPLTLALLDDLASRASMAAYRRHLIRRWAEGGDQLKKRQPSKHLTILCLEEVDKEAFVAANRIGSTANVLLLDADDIGPEEEILKSEHILKELAAQGRAQSLSSDSFSSSSFRDSVLVIDSVVPLLMEAMSSGSRNRTSKQEEQNSSVQAATKAVAAWLSRLHQQPRPFSHVVFTLHTDVFGASSHQYIELA